MKKKLKLYLHHSHYKPVTYSKKTGFFGYAEQFLLFVGNSILGVCYVVGMTVLALANIPSKIFKYSKNIPAQLKAAKSALKTEQARKQAFSFGVAVLLVAGLVHMLSLFAIGQDLKGKVLGDSDAALGYISDARKSLEAQNTPAAQANLMKALEQFKKSEESLNNTNTILRGLMAVVPQKHDADRLLNAAQKITEAGIKGTELLTMTNGLKLSAAGLTSEDNKSTLLKAQKLLDETVALADEAAAEIDRVSITSIPASQRPAFLAAQDAAKLYQSNVSSLKEVSALMFTILLGDKNTLIVFQNNNEIRANGGFIGTVGNAKLSDGSLQYLDIRSVYDWDGQLKEKIIPPQPLSAVNKQLYLRDANWFASFPESADRISNLFEKEGGETPDLIIALTPEVILDMLDRTGPITLPQYGVTLTKENFIEVSQTETSINYDKTLNQPKQFLADFFPLLMERLGSGENGMMTFLEVFQYNLYTKHILLYSRDPSIQKQIADFNWGGEMRSTERDYLSIVNSNLSGTKTDRSLQRKIEINSDINEAGYITNTIQYTVKNPLPNNPGLKNISFIRFYVPLGSRFLYSGGFNTNIVIPQVGGDGYVTDEKIANWQENVTQHTSTGTYIGRESNKTWFGHWLEIAGGEEKTVTISYALPFKLDSIDRHSLLLQKQPGSMPDEFAYRLNFPERQSLWQSTEANTNGASMSFSGKLSADTFVGIVFKK